MGCKPMPTNPKDGVWSEPEHQQMWSPSNNIDQNTPSKNRPTETRLRTSRSARGHIPHAGPSKDLGPVALSFKKEEGIAYIDPTLRAP